MARCVKVELKGEVTVKWCLGRVGESGGNGKVCEGGVEGGGDSHMALRKRRQKWRKWQGA